MKEKRNIGFQGSGYQATRTVVNSLNTSNNRLCLLGYIHKHAFDTKTESKRKRNAKQMLTNTSSVAILISEEYN